MLSAGHVRVEYGGLFDQDTNVKRVAVLREMIAQKKSLRALFEESEFEPRRKSVRMVLLLAALFMLGGSGVDVWVYPYFSGQFLQYRLAVGSILVIGWFVAGHVKRQWLLGLVTHLWILVPVFCIELMIYQVRDPASSYYGGINIMLVGAALLLRWRPRDSLLNAAICVLSFFALMYSAGLTYRGGVIPSYFVLVAGVVAVLAT